MGKQLLEVDQIEEGDFIESIIQEHVDSGSQNSNKNSKYEYWSHEEQYLGEHKKTNILWFNPNIRF